VIVFLLFILNIYIYIKDNINKLVFIIRNISMEIIIKKNSYLLFIIIIIYYLFIIYCLFIVYLLLFLL